MGGHSGSVAQLTLCPKLGHQSLHPSIFHLLQLYSWGSGCLELMHIHDGHRSCAQKGPSVTISTAGLRESFKRFSRSSKIKEVLPKLYLSEHQDIRIQTSELLCNVFQRFPSYWSYHWAHKYISPLYAFENFMNKESTHQVMAYLIVLMDLCMGHGIWLLN